MWVDHKNRFKSGANRAALRGVIKSSYLPEMGADSVGRRPVAAPRASPSAAGTSPVDNDRDDDEDSWEDVDCSPRNSGEMGEYSERDRRRPRLCL